jgi:hypothetical protein
VPLAPLHLAAVIASVAADADRRGLVRSAFWLWVGLAITGVIAVGVVWVMIGWTRSNRRAFRRRRIKDAWAEAGRRVEPLSHDDMQPDADPETEQPGGPT